MTFMIFFSVAAIAVWLYLAYRAGSRRVDTAIRQAERTPTLYDWAQERHRTCYRPPMREWREVHRR